MTPIASLIRTAAWQAKFAGLVDHAKEELSRAGLFDKDSDYEGMIGKAVMELMKTFSNQGHSGFSANMVLELFNRLGKYDILSPLKPDKKEWMQITVQKGNPVKYQSKRKPSCFSDDGLKTWYDIDKKPRRKRKFQK